MTSSPDASNHHERSSAGVHATLALTTLSLGFLVILAFTWSPMADRWTALPFALFMWAGFLTAFGATFLCQGRPRAIAGALTSVWFCVWVLTWSEDALDLVAVVRRAVLAFIAF